MAENESPTMPARECVTHRELPQGRVRSRRLGERRPDAPPVVVVMGMAVADYLMPALAALAEWTDRGARRRPAPEHGDGPRARQPHGRPEGVALATLGG